MNSISQLEEIFFAALDKAPGAARASFLDAECSGDAELRQRVEKMLAAHTDAASFLEAPHAAIAIEPGITTDLQAEPVGTMIGPYKLLELIGEGGMGLVYMAEQQRPVRRLVALKIIKPGMDSKQVIARFEAERQALAMMDHPNIARILDAGTVGESTKSEARSTKRIQSTNDKTQNEKQDDNDCPVSDIDPSNLEFVSDFEIRASDLGSGRPYFVMELVRGLPITDFCDQKSLSIPERLELFIEICQAVQHAHQKGIIHRDLKPTNVLVTMHDAVAVPKVIDFGIAKALGQQLTDHTLHTGFGQFIGTLLYMSPEQAELNAFGVDTRSDVYSLGVLLYELLTGTTPFEKDRLESVSFDEKRRIIREEEPETVSVRLARTKSSRHTPCAVNGGNGTRSVPATLGELDWIVARSLEKDRTRRYESPSALAADLHRYLSGDLVLACPPSTSYRFRKFAKKHRAAFTTAAIVAATLLLGITLSTWQAVRAMRAEAQAVMNKVKAEQEGQRARAAATAEEIQRRRAEAGERQARDNLQRARDAVDEMLTSVARKLLDVPQMETTRRELLENALKFYRAIYNENGSDPEIRNAAQLAYRRYATVQKMLGDSEKAEEAEREALIILQGLADEFPATAEYRHELAHTYTNLAIALNRNEKSVEATRMYEKAFEISESLVRDFPDNSEYQGWLAGRRHNIGLNLRRNGLLDEAEAVLRENLATRLRIHPHSSQPLWESHFSLADLLEKTGRSQEAEDLFRTALAHQEKSASKAPQAMSAQARLAETHFRLAKLLAVNKCRPEAEEHYKRAMEIDQQLASDFPAVVEHRNRLALDRFNFGRLLTESRRLSEAESMYRQAIDDFESLTSQFPEAWLYHHNLGATLHNLSTILRRRREWNDARSLLHRALEHQDAAAKLKQTDAAVRRCLRNHYAGLAASCVFDSAAVQVHASRGIEAASKSVELDPHFSFGHLTLGIARYRASDWEEAVKSLGRVIALGGDDADSCAARVFLAMAHWQLDDGDQARQWYEKAVQWMDKNKPDDEELRRFRAEAAELLNLQTQHFDIPAPSNRPN